MLRARTWGDELFVILIGKLHKSIILCSKAGPSYLQHTTYQWCLAICGQFYIVTHIMLIMGALSFLSVSAFCPCLLPYWNRTGIQDLLYVRMCSVLKLHLTLTWKREKIQASKICMLIPIHINVCLHVHINILMQRMTTIYIYIGILMHILIF